MSGYKGSVERRILQAAKDLFSEKGYEETKFREIAASAGTSESQIVKYFESKTGVLEALFKQARTYIDESLEEIMEETDDPAQVLEKASTLLIDFYKEDPKLLEIYLFDRRYYKLVSEEQLLREAEFKRLLSDVFRRDRKKVR